MCGCAVCAMMFDRMPVKRLISSAIVSGALLVAPSAVLSQSDRSLETVFNEAAAAMQTGDYPVAERGFNKVLQADPNNFPALGNLGVLYSRTHRFAKAIEVDDRALEIDPKDSAILLNLGLAYLKQEDYARARPYFQRLDAAQGGQTRSAILLATCMVLGDAPREGLDLIVSRKLDASDPSALYLEAVGYARLNQMQAGEAIFRRLLESSATRAQANFLLGQALHDGHRLQEAADSFTGTLEQDPTYPGAHRELGKVYISMQHFPDAERELRTAVKQDPQDGDALYFLGALFVQTAREAEGAPFLERAESLMPDSWAIPFYLGKAEVKRGHAAAAVPLLQKAASMNADEPQVFYLLAGALRATGHLEEAKAALTRVQTLHTSALDAEKQAMSNKVVGAR